MRFLPDPRPNGGQPIDRLQAVSCFVRFFRDPIACMRDIHRTHGPVAAVGDIIPGRRRPRLFTFAFGPKYNEQVLGHPDRFRNTGQVLRGPPDSAQRRVRFGLTRMTGEKHRQQRKLIVPALQHKAVESYYPAMVAIIDEQLDGWRDGETVDMWRVLRRMTLRLSSRLLFGVENPERADKLAELIERWAITNFSRGVWMFPVDVPHSPYRSLLRQAEALEREILSLVAEKRANPAVDALSMLVTAYDEETGRMSDADLVGQTTILFGASYETTVNALSWTMFLLAQHPAALHEVLDELDAKLGGAAPTFEQLGDLPALEAAIKESMRVLPPVPFTIRVARGAHDIGHIRVRDGDRVICSHYITHHMPELYAEPERYLPERWRTITPTQYEYLPFSAGPRLCIGYLFAMTALKAVLAGILQRWRCTVVPNARIIRAVRVTMAPAAGLPMTIHRQDRQLTASPVRGNVNEMVDLTDQANSLRSK